MRRNLSILAALVLLAGPALACGPVAAPTHATAQEIRTDTSRVVLLLKDHDKLVEERRKAPGFLRGAALEEPVSPEARTKAEALLARAATLLAEAEKLSTQGKTAAASAAAKYDEAEEAAKAALIAVGVHEFAIVPGCIMQKVPVGPTAAKGKVP